MTEINDAIYWWEQELTGEQREIFLKGDSWKGTIEERHERLLQFYHLIRVQVG